MHLPQRRKLAQLRDLALEQVDRVIDLLFRRESADGKPDRAVCELVAAAERAQNVRRFERRRRARGSRRDRDVLDRHDQALALDKVEADVEVVRDALFEVAVDVHLLDLGEPLRQPVAEHANAFVVAGHLQPRQPERLAHADDLVGGQRARTHATLVPPAVHLRLDAHARLATDEQRADTLRTVGLVCRERHQIHLERREVDRQLAGRLRTVDVENDAARTAHFADRRYILDDADLIVDVHHRDQNRVLAQHRLDLLQIEQSIRPDVQIGHLEALALELSHGVERRLMLGPDGDQVPALVLVEVGSALHSQVDRLGGARRPHQLLRVAIDQPGDFLARLLDGFLRFPAERMRARRRIAEMLGEIRNHLGRDAGIDRRRG